MRFPISALRRAGSVHVSRVQLAAGATVALIVAGAAVAALGGTSAPHASRAIAPVAAKLKGAGGTVRSGVAPAGGAPTFDSSNVALGGSAPAGSTAGEVAAAGTDQVAGLPAIGGLAPAPGSEKVIRSGSLQVQVKKGGVDRGYDAVAKIAADHGGYVASSTRSSGSNPSAQLEVRVPADRFDETRRALRAMGTVRNEELHGQDVTSQLVDMDARLRSLQVEEQTLRSLVGQAKTVGEVLQVQPQLFDIRRQIEQLQANRQQLDQQATLSTIAVDIAERGAASPTPRPRPVLVRSASNAWNAGQNVVGGMLVVLGATLPIALLGALIWLIARGRRRTAPEGSVA